MTAAIIYRQNLAWVLQRACGTDHSTLQPGSPHTRSHFLLRLLPGIRMWYIIVLVQGVLLLTLVDVLLTEVVILSGKHRTTQTWAVNGDGSELPMSPIIEPSAGGRLARVQRAGD